MAYVMALEGAVIKRTAELTDPKNIFEYIWKEFCLKIEITGLIPPLVFFIKKDVIEFFDFYPLTHNAQGKDTFLELVSNRIEQEIDIEGIALSVEVFIKTASVDCTETMCQPLYEKEKDQDSVMLSLDWRGIGSTFARFAKKLEVGGGCKLVNIVNAVLLHGQFTNLFNQDQLQAVKERITLQ